MIDLQQSGLGGVQLGVAIHLVVQTTLVLSMGSRRAAVVTVIVNDYDSNI